MEPNPVPGRHDVIFPMFEFEFKGDMNELMELQKELLNINAVQLIINIYLNKRRKILQILLEIITI